MKRFALIVALALLLAPFAVRADEPASSVPAKAKTLAARGRAAHDAGHYSDAIAAFTQAYAMAPAPALLFNLAQAYRLQGNCDDAALMYRRFIATNPSPEVLSLAENHLATVERCMHKLALNIPVDGAPASAPGFVASAAPMHPRGTTSVAGSLDRPSRKAEIEKDVGIGLVIGGSTSLAIATYYAFRAHNASNDVAAAYAKGAKWKDVAPIDARGKSAESRAQLFGVGGALGVAGGVVTYLIGKHTEQAPVTVVPTGHGVEVGMTWAF
ncbi:MAG: tetratricopeptide repeat protein [Kofleriaceae bacterium]